jgi:hypothetical protein
MSTDTMESAIAMDAAAILEIADLQDRDLDHILQGIRDRANNILATLNEGGPELAGFAALRCGGCGEAATAATDTTHRQWHCGCCGSWNDAPAGTEIVIGEHGEELRQIDQVAP